MGSCCGGSKKKEADNGPPTLDPLKKGSHLFNAQHMKKTMNGKPVNIVVMKKPMSEMEVAKSQVDPNISEDMKTIFGHPFNVCNKLTKYVYLSGIASLTKETLKAYQINLIINATYEWPKICPVINGKEVVNIRIPVDDSGEDDISIYFDEVSDKIEENGSKNGHTLVHCMAGASRSTTLVLAYLMKYERMSLLNAFKSVRKRREAGRPNIGFWDQLIKYEIRTRGMASTKMATDNIQGVDVTYPDFYKNLYYDLWKWEVKKQVEEKQKNDKSKAQKTFNAKTQTYE